MRALAGNQAELQFVHWASKVTGELVCKEKIDYVMLWIKFVSYYSLPVEQLCNI